MTVSRTHEPPEKQYHTYYETVGLSGCIRTDEYETTEQNYITIYYHNKDYVFLFNSKPELDAFYSQLCEVLDN